MSAFMVEREHIDLIVAVGLHGPRGVPVSPGTAWYRLSWFDCDPAELAAASVTECAAHRRELRFDTADEVGQMLVDENARSIFYRYPDTLDGGEIPGDASALDGYSYTDPRYRPTAVEALKALDCFEYQACEHDGWRSSEAWRFCEALRSHLISRLAGYDEAPWSWGARELRQAGQRAA